MPLPPNDSPFWPILRDFLRLVFAVVFAAMIYNTVDFRKDLLMILGILFGNGLVSGGTGLLKKMMKDHEEGGDNDDATSYPSAT